MSAEVAKPTNLVNMVEFVVSDNKADGFAITEAFRQASVSKFRLRRCKSFFTAHHQSFVSNGTRMTMYEML